jgi:hypothetical protein
MACRGVAPREAWPSNLALHSSLRKQGLPCVAPWAKQG